MRSLPITVVGAVALVALLAGCASTGFLGFIATTGYVDKHLSAEQKKTQAQIAENTNQVHKVQSDVKNLDVLKSTLESLITEVKQNTRSTGELKKLAAGMETRLNQIPRDTLAELVQILQQYLKQSTVSPVAKHG